jgi:hypothetical protein
MALNPKYKKLVAIIGISLVIIIIVREPTIVKSFLRDMFVFSLLNKNV